MHSCQPKLHTFNDWLDALQLRLDALCPCWHEQLYMVACPESSRPLGRHDALYRDNIMRIPVLAAAAAAAMTGVG